MNLRKQDKQYEAAAAEQQNLFDDRGALILDLRRQRAGLQSEVERLKVEVARWRAAYEAASDGETTISNTTDDNVRATLTAGNSSEEVLLEPGETRTVDGIPDAVEIED